MFDSFQVTASSQCDNFTLDGMEHTSMVTFSSLSSKSPYLIVFPQCSNFHLSQIKSKDFLKAINKNSI